MNNLDKKTNPDFDYKVRSNLDRQFGQNNMPNGSLTAQAVGSIEKFNKSGPVNSIAKRVFVVAMPIFAALQSIYYLAQTFLNIASLAGKAEIIHSVKKYTRSLELTFTTGVVLFPAIVCPSYFYKTKNMQDLWSINYLSSKLSDCINTNDTKESKIKKAKQILNAHNNIANLTPEELVYWEKVNSYQGEKIEYDGRFIQDQYDDPTMDIKGDFTITHNDKEEPLNKIFMKDIQRMTRIINGKKVNDFENEEEVKNIDELKKSIINRCYTEFNKDYHLTYNALTLSTQNEGNSLIKHLNFDLKFFWGNFSCFPETRLTSTIIFDDSKTTLRCEMTFKLFDTSQEKDVKFIKASRTYTIPTKYLKGKLTTELELDKKKGVSCVDKFTKWYDKLEEAEAAEYPK